MGGGRMGVSDPQTSVHVNHSTSPTRYLHMFDGIRLSLMNV